MTETKKHLYKLEDFFALGVTLPMIAYKQLQSYVPSVPEDDCALKFVKNHVCQFLKENEEDYTDKDERAITRAFMREKKAHPDYLLYYRETLRIMQKLGIV